ncbi:Uncharacterised protein [BD1-7 clade bacterium]|uniref:Lipoprotein n=1 Tax=BD1-7 clade bacterium TaxID=2029982 RepID=A0A5S9Q038_9GAMM|nr:Uncharacterised protein [BD1-7 clade bacterium]CAA0112456.1 Uncharacterised protein [BD1-7 clade bacterium]
MFQSKQLQVFTALIVLAGCTDNSNNVQAVVNDSQAILEVNKPNHELAAETVKSKAEESIEREKVAVAEQLTAPTALDYIQADQVYNPESVIPPQCYTKTDSVNNPCFVCHQSYNRDTQRTNMMNDGDLQGAYEFSDLGTKNHWKNLFVDRQDEIAKVSDEFIRSYVDQENYSGLIKWMNSDAWSGPIPVIAGLENGASAFDENGLAKDGSRWVAFNYKPLPSTFWPTNGSTDDVMIRLPAVFSQHKGQFSADVYFANLAMVEMTIKDLPSISSVAIDEVAIGQDLNGDGKLNSNVSTVEQQKNYVGDASNVDVVHMLYPQGTEFLHTVRYLGLDAAGNVGLSKRFKEYRYMQKHTFYDNPRLVGAYYQEEKEKHFENLPTIVHFGDRGTDNGFGWMLIGFIEDENGELRPQHEQEQAFCVGCHKTIGTTIDQTFSFARKVEGVDGWSYIDLTKIQDVPNIGETQGEYHAYMERVGGGDEFRQNEEMLSRWFDESGIVKKDKVDSADSIYTLIAPSAERASALNKAYYLIVKEQSYLFGRDPVLKPATNVIRQIDTEVAPLGESRRFEWDIRLDWSHDQRKASQMAGEAKTVK